MIVEQPVGHIDTDLCCALCGKRSLWQSENRSPCYDEWWCNRCGEWVEPAICGPHPRQVYAPVLGGETNPYAQLLALRELRPAC